MIAESAKSSPRLSRTPNASSASRGSATFAALALSAFSLVLSGSASPALAQGRVDDLSLAQSVTAIDVPTGVPGTQSGSILVDGGIFGGERDLRLEATIAPPAAGALILADRQLSASIAGGVLTLTSLSNVIDPLGGRAVLHWDGVDGSFSEVAPTGLGGVDLTDEGGNPRSAFRFPVSQATAGSSLTVEVFTDATNASQASVVLPAVVASTDFFLDFSEFIPSRGSGADFTSVGAVTLEVAVFSPGLATSSVVLSAFETVGPQLAGAKADALSVDADLDSLADPGDELTYTVTITNTGGEATTVDLQDMIDANTTLVADSLSTTPVAHNDQYSTFGNVLLTVDGSAEKPGLLTDDTDPDTDALTITAFDATTVNGGTIVITDTGTGTFTYDPPSGFRGADAFSYTVEDDDANTATATATIRVEGLVWFVDNSHTGTFAGTQTSPFNLLKDAESFSSPGDILRVREGDGTDTGYNAGLILKDRQILVGGAEDLVVSGSVIETGAGPSILSNSLNVVIFLARDNSISGITLNPTVGAGLAGGGTRGGNVDNVTINPSASAAGVVLFNHTDGFAFSNSSITGASVTSAFAVSLSTVGGTFDFTGSSIANQGGGLIRVVSSPGAVFDFTGTNPTLTAGTADGISLETNVGAIFTFDSIGPITTNGGNGYRIFSSGTVNLDLVGAVDATAGAALDISGTSVAKTGGGAITFPSLTSINNVFGIRLDGVAAPITVSGDGAMTGGALDRNGSGGTLTTTGNAVQLIAAQDVTLRQMNIPSPGGDGIEVLGGGDVTVTALAISGAVGRGIEVLADSTTIAGTTITLENNDLDSSTLEAILVTSAELSDLDVIIRDNRLGDDGGGGGSAVATGGHQGIEIRAEDDSHLDVLIDGNRVRNTGNGAGDFTLDLDASPAGTGAVLHATVTGNVLTNAGTIPAETFEAAVLATGASLCLDLRTNTASGTGTYELDDDDGDTTPASQNFTVEDLANLGINNTGTVNLNDPSIIDNGGGCPEVGAPH